MNTQAYVTEGVTSNTLLRLAVEAVRDGAIESFEVRRAPIVLTEYYIMIDRAGDEMRFAHDWIEDAIAYIRSQYVETFDIRSLDDLQCIKEGATGVLLNGAKFEVVKDSSNYENRDRIVINVGDANIYVNLAILAGASVTQGKYKE